jgi:ankyrin repeat protein
MLKRILKGASKHKVSYNDNDNDNDKGAPSKTYKPDPDVENEQLVDLYHATWIGDLATVKTLLTKLDNPNGRPHQPPLLAALKRGHKEIVDELLKHPKIDLNLTFFEATCLGTVVLNGDERNLETLLKQPKIDINQLSLSVTPLLIAVRMNHLNIVKMLLREPKIDVNKGVQSAAFDQAKSISTKFVISPIQYAAMKGQLEIVKLLLNDPRLDKTSLKWTPLHIACVTDDLNMFYQCIENINKALIASKVQNNSMHREDFNSRDSMEMTPMHYLANSKNLDMVKVLLQTEEVDLTLTEIMNKTPIWFAYCQILQNIKWMIASGKGLAIRTKSAGIPPEDWPTHAIQVID